MIYNLWKKSVMTVSFILSASSKQSCLLNEPRSASSLQQWDYSMVIAIFVDGWCCLENIVLSWVRLNGYIIFVNIWVISTIYLDVLTTCCSRVSRTHCSSMVFALLSNQCLSDDEMVSALASVAPSSFLQVLIVSVNLVRTSSGFTAICAIKFIFQAIF
jgi:hypothetical protein